MKFCYPFVLCSLLAGLTAPLLADSSTAPSSAGSAQSILEKLAGKHKVIGLTERGGSRFLGRVVSGDHGLYIFQTFHYMSASTTAREPVTATGRYRRTNRAAQLVTTQNVIADDIAVRALLSGVTGSTYRPREENGPREMISPADVLCIQELSPPTAKTPTATAAPAGGLPVLLPVPPTSASAGWTLKTLWVSADLPAPKAAPAK